jgi:hypothetical protein
MASVSWMWRSHYIWWAGAKRDGTPKGTPKDVITKLNVGINKALTDPEVSKKLADVGISVPGGQPEVFGCVGARMPLLPLWTGSDRKLAPS